MRRKDKGTDRWFSKEEMQINKQYAIRCFCSVGGEDRRKWNVICSALFNRLMGVNTHVGRSTRGHDFYRR